MIWNQPIGTHPAASVQYAGFGGFNPFAYLSALPTVSSLPDSITATTVSVFNLRTTESVLNLRTTQGVFNRRTTEDA